MSNKHTWKIIPKISSSLTSVWTDFITEFLIIIIIHSLLLIVRLEFPISKEYIQVVGSCDGLLCLAIGKERDIMLWNPSTREYHGLIRSPGPYPLIDNILYGFGYDQSTHTYKVMKSTHRKFGMNLLSLKTNSCWHNIECPEDYIVPVSQSGTNLNGAIHWMAIRYLFGPRKYNKVIVGLDLGQQKFKEMQLPEICTFVSNVPLHWEFWEDAFVCWNVMAIMKCG